MAFDTSNRFAGTARHTPIATHPVQQPTQTGSDAGTPDPNGINHGNRIAQAIADRMASELGQTRYENLIEPLVRFDVAHRALRVLIPSDFHRAWLHRRLGQELLESAYESTCGQRPAEVRWEVDPARFREHHPAAATHTNETHAPVTHSPNPRPASRRPTDDHHAPSPRAAANRRRFALAEFIVGDSNRLAYNAALEMARREPGESGAAALFLHGECGVGKTHLLNGVISEVKAQRPGARVRCVTGEVFANEFIAAVQRQDFESFRERYRGLELLCIDDVHFLAGKRKTMVELLHTFDALDLDGARVILASDEHPKRIEKLSHRLVSRCVSGMVVRIERPDRALRERLARKMAERRGFRLADASVSAVAETCVSSVREIEGAVVKIEAYVKLFHDRPANNAHADEAVSPDTVRRALGETMSRKPPKPVRTADISSVVCEELGVEPSELYGRSRHRMVVLARSMVASLARELTTQSYPEIARSLSRRNHSTVVTACQRTRRSIERGEIVDAGARHGRIHLGELRDRLKEEVTQRIASVSA